MLRAAMAGYAERVKLADRIAMKAGWHIAALAPERSPRMPSLASLIDPPNPANDWHAAKIWAAENGATITEG